MTQKLDLNIAIESIPTQLGIYSATLFGLPMKVIKKTKDD